MAELSPAAQAVRQAAINAKPGHTIPAALRAAADEILPSSSDWHEAFIALAAELDGTNPTSQEH